MNQNASKQIIQEICKLFQDEKNPNNVNLLKLRQYLNKQKNLTEAFIFKKKLETVRRLDSMSKQQFEQLFSPNITKKENFELVFQQIDKDGSGKISKKELELINKELGLGLSNNDINLMINFASKDGQKVLKEDLYKFITS